jgi:transcriptional regulator with XRE-family HTH domain
MNAPGYMDERWFVLLRAACRGRRQAAIAARLGLSGGTVSQVLNGTGKYGTGQATTTRIARRVLEVLGHGGDGPAGAKPFRHAADHAAGSVLARRICATLRKEGGWWSAPNLARHWSSAGDLEAIETQLQALHVSGLLQCRLLPSAPQQPTYAIAAQRVAPRACAFSSEGAFA